MPKNLIITLSVILILIILGLFGTAYFIGRSTQQSTGEVLRDFIPFGEGGTRGDGGDTLSETGDGTSDARDRETLPITTSKLRQLTSSPIAGASAFSDEEGSLSLRYVDQSSGNIYTIDLENNKRTRLTNSTILGVKNVLWDREGDYVLMQYLDANNTVKSFLGEILPEEGAVLAKLDGVFIDDDITAIASSPNKESLFYLTNFGSSVIGTRMNFDGSGKQQIFGHPIKEWRVLWPSRSTLSLTTKPSERSLGYAFLVGATSGEIKNTLSEIVGLTTNFSPDVERVIVSDISGGTLRTRLYNTERETFTNFPLITLPEKCVWSTIDSTIVYCASPETLPEGEYPDDWYKGLISFTDNLWRIDTSLGSVSFLASPHDIAGEKIDVVDIFLGSDEGTLFFTNKKDGTLWSLEL